MINKQRIALWLTIICILSACDTTNYTDTQGNTGHFSDHQGQWLIINYWAVWCKPCIEEIPELNQFAHDNRHNTTVFAVNFDGVEGETLISQAKQLGIEFPILTEDPAALLGFPRPNVLPTTVVFNPQGELHRTLIGPQTLASLEKVTRY